MQPPEMAPNLINASFPEHLKEENNPLGEPEGEEVNLSAGGVGGRAFCLDWRPLILGRGGIFAS